MKIRIIIRLAVLTGILLFLSVCTLVLFPAAVTTSYWQTDTSEPDLDTSPPIQYILICVDALRYDAVTPALMPSLSGLIQDWNDDTINYTRCYSNAPWTLPSVASIFTGVYPSQHGANRTTNRIRDDIPTLGDWLSVNGYASAAILNNEWITRRSGMMRGIQTVEQEPKASAAYQFTRASDWIYDHQDDDFFLYVHLMETHVPYDPYQLPDTFAPTEDDFRYETYDIIEQRRIEGLYRLSAAEVDTQIELFFMRLRSLEIYDQAHIIIFSDHGEEFWEHDGFEHGHALNDEVIHVPLIVKPGTSPLRLLHTSPDAVCSLRDIYYMVTDVEYPDWPDPQYVVSESLLYGEDRIRAIGDNLSQNVGIREPDDRDWLSYPFVFDYLSKTRLAVTNELAELTEQELEELRAIGYF